MAWDKGAYVLPPELAHVFHDQLHVEWLRYLVQRPTVEKERGKFDFLFMDPTVDNARTAGMKVILDPYFYQSFVTGGRDIMSSYDCACTKGAVSIPESDAPSFCYDVPVFDTQANYDFGVAMAEHFGGRVDLFGVDNEPGVRDYWITSRDELSDEDGAKRSTERWHNQAAVPFVRGVRSVLPHARFMTQFDMFCDAAHCLKIEQESGERVYDIIGSHPYNDIHVNGQSIMPPAGMSHAAALHMRRRRAMTAEHTRHLFREQLYGLTLPQAAPPLMHATLVIDGIDIEATTGAVIAKQREFESRIAPYRDGRELWIGEIQHCNNVRLMHETGYNVTEHNPARFIDLYDQWYHDENGKLATRLASRSGKWELTEEGKELAQRLSVPRHRRPTAS